MKHTSLNIIRYGSITRHYKKCSRCLKRSANNGCRLGRYLWARYMIASKAEKPGVGYRQQYEVSISPVYREFYNV